MVPQPCHGPAKREGQLLGATAGMVADLQRRMPAEERDRALARAEAFLDMQRLPGALLLIFSHTKGELRRMTESCLGDLVRLSPADVRTDETEGTADGRVRAKAVPEGVVPTVDTNLLANGAVDDRHGGGREGGDVKAVNAELLFAHGLDTSHNYGKVGWVATRHDRIDGDLLNCGAAIVGADHTDEFLWVAVYSGEHPLNALFGRRHHRQAVGHAARKEQLNWIVFLGLNALRAQRGWLRHGIPPYATAQVWHSCGLSVNLYKPLIARWILPATWYKALWGKGSK